MIEHTPPSVVALFSPPSQVALVADRGALGPVAVTTRDAARVHFSRADGTSQKSGASRLYWSGEATVTALSELDAFFATCTAIAEEIDFPALYARLQAQPDANEAQSADAMAALADLAPHIANGYALALGAFDDSLYFKVRDGMFTPEHSGTVAHTLRQREERRLRDTRIADTLPSVIAGLRGELNLLSPKAAHEAIFKADPELAEALIHVAALGRESPHVGLADDMLEALQAALQDETDRLPMTCRADAIQKVISRKMEDLLVHLGILPKHPNLAPLRAGIPVTFDAALMAEAERVVGAPPPVPALVLDGLRPYAIDDIETTEIDDAIALDLEDPRRVHVLIADAGAWVTPGSPLDAAARERLTTLYLPDQRIPMLPPTIANDGASLLTGKPRTAIVISATITSDGTPAAITVTRALVTNTQRLTYDAVEEALSEGQNLDETATADLRQLELLSTLHRKWRHDNGAVTFQRPEINYHLQPSGNIDLKIGAPLSRARQLVSELMVMACHAVAKFCVTHEIPCLFRSQAEPDELPEAPDPKTGRIDDPVKQNDLMRRLKPSLLTTDPRVHWTLGVASYTQITSPIRRYTDLVMHQQLVSWLETGKPSYRKGDLDALIAHITKSMSRVKRADHESRRLFALRWLEQEHERIFDAVVLREIGRRYLIDLTMLGWHEAMQLRGRRRPGAHLRVRVDLVDFTEGSVIFREV